MALVKLVLHHATSPTTSSVNMKEVSYFELIFELFSHFLNRNDPFI
jgi:hypothetical protein